MYNDTLFNWSLLLVVIVYDGVIPLCVLGAVIFVGWYMWRKIGLTTKKKIRSQKSTKGRVMPPDVLYGLAIALYLISLLIIIGYLMGAATDYFGPDHEIPDFYDSARTAAFLLAASFTLAFYTVRSNRVVTKS